MYRIHFLTKVITERGAHDRKRCICLVLVLCLLILSLSSCTFVKADDDDDDDVVFIEGYPMLEPNINGSSLTLNLTWDSI